jgi:regulator of replication initiation timing
MQITLKQAVASFAQEKHLHQKIAELLKENQSLKEENSKLKQES